MDDPVIDEIRRARRKISAEIGPKLEGLVDRYAELEKRFVKPPITKGLPRQPVAPEQRG